MPQEKSCGIPLVDEHQCRKIQVNSLLDVLENTIWEAGGFLTDLRGEITQLQRCRDRLERLDR